MRTDIYIHDHRRRQSRDDWSPEAREAAAKARAAHAHHAELQAHHANEATGRGENLAKPAKGSHAETSSHHGSAAFYHKRAAEEHEAGKSSEAHEYTKKGEKSGKTANKYSENLAKGKGGHGGEYPSEKENSYKPEEKTSQEHAAARGARYLSQKHIGPIRR